MRAATLFVGLIALIGLPPAGTFLAKVSYFTQLWEKYQNGQQGIVLVLLIIALILTAVSVFYYLRIPYNIYLKKGASELGLPKTKLSGSDWGYVLMAILLIGSLINPNLFFELLKV